MYVTLLINGNAISGTEVSHLWYHDLVYLHFLTFFSFPLAEERGTQQASQEMELEWGQAWGRGWGWGWVRLGHEWWLKWFD